MINISVSKSVVPYGNDLAGKIMMSEENAPPRPDNSSDLLHASSQNHLCPFPARPSFSTDSVDADKYGDSEDIFDSWDNDQFGILRKSVSLGALHDRNKPAVSNSARDSRNRFLWSSSVPLDSTDALCTLVKNEAIDVSDDDLDLTSNSLSSPSISERAQVQCSHVARLDNHAKLTGIDIEGNRDGKDIGQNFSWASTSPNDHGIGTSGLSKISFGGDLTSVKLSDSPQILPLSSSFEHSSEQPQSLELSQDGFFSPTALVAINNDKSLRSSFTSDSNTYDRSTPNLSVDISSSFFSSPSLADLIDLDVPPVDVDDQPYSSPSRSSLDNCISKDSKRAATEQSVHLPPPTVSTVQDFESECGTDVESDAGISADITCNQPDHVLSPYPAPRTCLRSQLVASLPYPKRPKRSIDSIFGVPKLGNKISRAMTVTDSRMKWMARTVPRAPRWSKRRKMTFGESDIDSPTALRHGVKEDELAKLEFNFTAWQEKFKHECQGMKSILPVRTDLAINQPRSAANCTSQFTIPSITESVFSRLSPQAKRSHARLGSSSSPSPTFSSSPLARTCLEKKRAARAEAPRELNSFDLCSEQDKFPQITEVKRSRDEERGQISVGKSFPPPSPSLSVSPMPYIPARSSVNESSLVSSSSCAPNRIGPSPLPEFASQTCDNLTKISRDEQTSEDEDAPLLKRPFTCAYTRSVSPDTSWMKQRQLSIDVPDDEDPLACVGVW